MNGHFQNCAYPTHAFPMMIQNAMTAVGIQTQVMPELVGTLTVGVMSEAVQGVADVQIPQGPLCPTSTWVLAVVDSGGGKTPTLNLLRNQSIQAFEAAQLQAYQCKFQQYETDRLTWQLELDELSSALRKAVRKQLDTTELKQSLAAHMQQAPKKPRRVKLSYPDATIEAFCHGLAEHWPNASLPTDEASMFLNGHMANGLASLNQCWDGQPICLDRRSQGQPLTVDAPRVSVILGIQSGQLEKYFNRRGTEIRDLGTLPRMLICCPPDNQGFRNVMPTHINPAHLAWFHDRAQELLKQSMTDAGDPISTKRVITFSPEAEARFHQLRIEYENSIGPGCFRQSVRDFIAKATRHVARLAAIFEVFENGSDVISLDMLERAICLVNWYAVEYQRLLTPPPELPQELRDAEELYPWLWNFMQRRCNRYLIVNDIRKHAPNALRDTPRLKAALLNLGQRGMLVYYILDKIHYIDMQPQLIQDSSALQFAIESHRTRRMKKVYN